MTFPKRNRNWKRAHPSNLRDAFRLCKEYGQEKRNLSVARIAELMGETEDSLYKWLSTGRMPTTLIPNYEHVCGIHFVTEYLAAGARRLVVEIPAGRKADEASISELQITFGVTTQLLVQFYSGDADQAETEAALIEMIRGLAWHQENIARYTQPELGLDEVQS